MTIPSISGEDNITKLANASMYATLVTLNKEGFLTNQQFNTFSDNYSAIYVDPESGGFINWLKRRFLPKQPFIVVAKMITEDDR